MHGWEPSSHVSYREWATEALGDERQIYARSTTSPERKLIFLPDGESESYREAARAGELVCPVPGCPSPRLTTRGPADRRHHFVHRQAPADAAHRRAYVKRVATELLVEWIQRVHPRSTVEADVEIKGLPVTATVEGPSGRRFAVMFVDQRLGVEAWWELDSKLERLGFARGWIFSPRQYLRYPQPSPDADAEDPAAIDRRRGDIVLDRPVFRELRRLGRWPLLMNVSTRGLANLVAPGGEIARHLDLKPPASGDRVLHVVPTPLDDCRLSVDGVATPAVNADVLAAPRLAREKREKARQEREAVRAADSARLAAWRSDLEIPAPLRYEQRQAPPRHEAKRWAA